MLAGLVALLTAISGIGYTHDESLFRYEEGKLYINSEASYRATCTTEEGKVLIVRKSTLDPKECKVLVVEGKQGHHIFRIRVMKSWEGVVPMPEGVDIIPLESPWDRNVGRKLNYGVFLEGKPVEDVRVFINGKQAGVTREGGKIRLRLREGVNELEAVVEKQDREYIGVLIFER